MADGRTDFAGLAQAYDLWTKAQGIPIYEGYHIEDLKTLALGWWEARRCSGAFLKLAGQEGVSEARVTEIPPGETLPARRFALDEIVYAVQGRGLTTVWAEGKPKRTFEWQEHSMFLIPRNYTLEMSNMQGEKPARLLHYNSLPLAMSMIPDPDFFFDNSVDQKLLCGLESEFFSEAKAVARNNTEPGRRQRFVWIGNFFPDMRRWDKLDIHSTRGAGGHVVAWRASRSTMKGHMSVFPAGTYKKAHRHGPGVVIVIPAGEGYSIMWQDGQEKQVVRWHAGSVFVPPSRWFHQHFNVGETPARYLAFHAPGILNTYSEKVEDLVRDQIEYADEEPWIREKFRAELASRGLASKMPEEAYRDRNYQWPYE